MNKLIQENAQLKDFCTIERERLNKKIYKLEDLIKGSIAVLDYSIFKENELMKIDEYLEKAKGVMNGN